MYKQFFGLDSLPFLTTPQLGYFQPLKDHALAIDTVLYALSQGDAFIQVTGEVGVGKTMTLRYIINQLKDLYSICYIPSGQMSSASMMSLVMHELSDSPPAPRYGQQYQLEDIQQWLIYKFSEGRRCVVFVDEAQTFSDHCLELLRLMTNLETEHEKLMQIVLFGQPELKKKLNQAHLRQLAQRIHYRVEIAPPSFKDMQQYLVDRLVSAGHSHGQLFTYKAAKALYLHSQGTLRLVNILAHKALLSAYADDRNYVVASDVLSAVQETGYKHQHAWSYKTLLKYITRQMEK